MNEKLFCHRKIEKTHKIENPKQKSNFNKDNVPR